MDREQAIRDGERAAVERWFPRSPLGRLFDPGDGRMLQIREDAIPAWRAEAFGVIDDFLADTRGLRWPAVAILVAVAVVSGVAIAVHQGAWSAVAVGIGMAVAHALGMLRHRRYLRDLAAVRARIRASLAIGTPLPIDWSQRFQRSNRWRVALNIWVGALVVAAGLAAHAAPVAIPPFAITLGIGGIGLAWLLFFLARRTDRAQRPSR